MIQHFGLNFWDIDEEGLVFNLNDTLEFEYIFEQEINKTYCRLSLNFSGLLGDFDIVLPLD